MKKILYTIILALSATMLSCNLDEFPDYAIATQPGKPMIENIKDVEYFTNGLLTTFRSNLSGDSYYVSEVVCDAFNATISSGYWMGDIHSMGKNFTASNNYTSVIWNKEYLNIKDYNIFLEEIQKFTLVEDEEDASEEDREKHRILVEQSPGYAYLFRAKAYLNLVRYYGKAYDEKTAETDLGVPIITKWSQELKPARSSVAEVYKQIKLDLDSAAIHLKEARGQISSVKPTADCVNFMYARYYLDIKSYDKAAEYAEKVINSEAGYYLASDSTSFEMEFHYDQGGEAIMQVTGGYEEWSGGLCRLYTNANYKRKYSNIMGGIYFIPDYIPTKKLIESYSEDDLRFKCWYTNKYVTYNNGIENVGKFYTFIKFLGNPRLNEYGVNGVPNARQFAKPFKLNEIYLIAAEAHALNGNEAKAQYYLNAIQRARHAQPTSATMDNIKKEWFRETVGDGQRMVCLKRWRDGFKGREPQEEAFEANIIYKSDGFVDRDFPSDDVHWQWPISTYELRVNPNIEQNPGYKIFD